MHDFQVFNSLGQVQVPVGYGFALQIHLILIFIVLLRIDNAYLMRPQWIFWLKHVQECENLAVDLSSDATNVVHDTTYGMVVPSVQ